ncbi:MAG: site-specific integrase [Pirellulales bacterium]
MPYSPNHVPRYRKHRSSGQAVVTLGGRDFYLGPHGTKASYNEYDRRLSEWIAAGRPRAYASEGKAPPTVIEVAAAYLRYARTFYGDGPNSELHRIKRVIRPLRELYGRTNARDFGPLEFKAVRAKLIDDGLARKVVNQHMGRLARMFKWAASEPMVSADVWRALTTVDGLRRGKSAARETAPVKPVDGATVDATLACLPAVVAAMVRVQRLTACRPTEACILRPCDLDRTGDVWLYRPASHKTAHHGHARTIFVGPQAQAVLLPYLDRDPAAYCFSPRESELTRKAAKRKTPPNQGNRAGMNTRRKTKRKLRDHYDAQTYARAIRYGCAKAGVAVWSPNQLRHAAATELRRTHGLEAAQVILGHTKADVTQIYAERDVSRGVAVIREIG